MSEQDEALAVLGLTAGATQEQIKQAFRRLVKRHHPDVGGSARAFRRLNEAYQRLMAWSQPCTQATQAALDS